MRALAKARHSRNQEQGAEAPSGDEPPPPPSMEYSESATATENTPYSRVASPGRFRQPLSLDENPVYVRFKNSPPLRVRKAVPLDGTATLRHSDRMREKKYVDQSNTALKRKWKRFSPETRRDLYIRILRLSHIYRRAMYVSLGKAFQRWRRWFSLYRLTPDEMAPIIRAIGMLTRWDRIRRQQAYRWALWKWFNRINSRFMEEQLARRFKVGLTLLCRAVSAGFFRRWADNSLGDRALRSRTAHSPRRRDVASPRRGASSPERQPEADSESQAAPAQAAQVRLPATLVRAEQLLRLYVKDRVRFYLSFWRFQAICVRADEEELRRDAHLGNLATAFCLRRRHRNLRKVFHMLVQNRHDVLRKRVAVLRGSRLLTHALRKHRLVRGFSNIRTAKDSLINQERTSQDHLTRRTRLKNLLTMIERREGQRTLRIWSENVYYRRRVYQTLKPVLFARRLHQLRAALLRWRLKSYVKHAQLLEDSLDATQKALRKESARVVRKDRTQEILVYAEARRSEFLPVFLAWRSVARRDKIARHYEKAATKYNIRRILRHALRGWILASNRGLLLRKNEQMRLYRRQVSAKALIKCHNRFCLRLYKYAFESWRDADAFNMRRARRIGALIFQARRQTFIEALRRWRNQIRDSILADNARDLERMRVELQAARRETARWQCAAENLSLRIVRYRHTFMTRWVYNARRRLHLYDTRRLLGAAKLDAIIKRRMQKAYSLWKAICHAWFALDALKDSRKELENIKASKSVLSTRVGQLQRQVEEGVRIRGIEKTVDGEERAQWERTRSSLEKQVEVLSEVVDTQRKMAGEQPDYELMSQGSVSRSRTPPRGGPSPPPLPSSRYIYSARESASAASQHFFTKSPGSQRSQSGDAWSYAAPGEFSRRLSPIGSDASGGILVGALSPARAPPHKLNFYDGIVTPADDAHWNALRSEVGALKAKLSRAESVYSSSSKAHRKNLSSY